jgi:hypothetical protein
VRGYTLPVAAAVKSNPWLAVSDETGVTEQGCEELSNSSFTEP